MNQQQAAQAVSIAAAHAIDRYTVPNDVTYLVLNGIDPDEAARRVISHRRRMVVWGYAVAGSLLWIGVALGWGTRLLVAGIGKVMLGRGIDPVQLAVGSACALVGSTWVYVLLMSAVWSWRHAARGCVWEDSRNPWLPSLRPSSGVSAAVAPAEGRTRPLVISIIVLTLAAVVIVVPVLNGFTGGVAELLGRS